MPQEGYTELVDRGGGIGLRVFTGDGSIVGELYGVRESEDTLRSMANYLCSNSGNNYGYGLRERDRYTDAQWQERQRGFESRYRREYADYRRRALAADTREFDREPYTLAMQRSRRSLEELGVEFNDEGEIIEPPLIINMGESIEVALGLEADIRSGWVVQST